MADRILIEADADLWRRTGVAYPACSGACNQGRSPCPCPEACEQPITDADAHERAVFWWVYIVLLVAVVSAVFLPFGAQ